MCSQGLHQAPETSQTAVIQDHPPAGENIRYLITRQPIGCPSSKGHAEWYYYPPCIYIGYGAITAAHYVLDCPFVHAQTVYQCGCCICRQFFCAEGNFISCTHVYISPVRSFAKLGDCDVYFAIENHICFCTFISYWQL